MSLRAFAKMRNNPNLEFVNFLNNNVAVASAYSPQECACRWQAHCVSNLEKSTQGVTTLCYKKWIALARLKPQSEPRNDKFFYFKLLTKNLNNVIILPL